MRCKLYVAALAAAVLAPSVSFGALFFEDFETDPTANWTVNKGPATTDEAHDFFFDYSTVGVPLAPNSAPDASPRGVKLQANQSSGVFGGVSVSPTGMSFPGPAVLKFDWWSNFNGPAPVGGSGSTQMSTFGLGTSGTVAQWPGGTQDSIWFGATGDGNSASDWRAYSPAPAGVTRYADTAAGIYAAGAVAGSSNASNAYYASLGTVSAPAAQTLLFPQQTGTTLVGSAAFEWHEVVIENDGTTMSWTVDGLLIATVPVVDDTVATGSNFFLGHADTNGTSSTDVNDVHLLFTLIDNVSVTVPEPGSLLLASLALVGIACRRGRQA
jgi:hypothetical protein